MKKVIILNAPPGAGKDTIGALLEKTARQHVVTMSFKEPMFNIALAMLGKELYRQFLLAYNDREQKEKPQAFLNGKSPREFMIWISEDVIKPQFGEQYFGLQFAMKAREYPYDIICTDGGFPEEIKPLISAGLDAHICRLHRAGFTFEGDSRDYIVLDNYHHRLHSHDFILVDGDPMHTVNQIKEVVCLP